MKASPVDTVAGVHFDVVAPLPALIPGVENGLHPARRGGCLGAESYALPAVAKGSR
jgi:hypothetical protein